jgi:hypothetical protein
MEATNNVIGRRVEVRIGGRLFIAKVENIRGKRFSVRPIATRDGNQITHLIRDDNLRKRCQVVRASACELFESDLPI